MPRSLWLQRVCVLVLGACVLFASTVAVGATTSHGTPRGRSAPITGRVRLTKIASISGSTALAVRYGDPTLYIATKKGTVVAVRDGVMDDRPVLDLSSQVSDGREQGLLGLTFSPDASLLYVYYTDHAGTSMLEEYRVSAASHSGIVHADPTSRRIILEVPQPQATHNGGQLVFGPDGYLYLGLGDGGGKRDSGHGHAPEGNAQSLTSPLGKILRIDASRPPEEEPVAAPGNVVVGTTTAQIFALGLRNPWRFSFDRETGDLWVADVGQNHNEEINLVRAGTRPPFNFGWPLLEGTRPMRDKSAPGAILPILELSHRDGNCAVIGGYVYRGERIANLSGAYVFSDLCDGRIRALHPRRAGAGRVTNLGIRVSTVSAFGQDRRGELYVLSFPNGVYRIDVKPAR